MKKKIDEWIENKKKDFIDYETYFNENKPDSVELFDKFIGEFPLNIIDPLECYQIINNEKLTHKERRELFEYLENRISKINEDEYEKRYIELGRLDNLINDYLYKTLEYNDKNKDIIFKQIQKLIDYDEDYKTIYNQFNEVSKIVLNIIKAVK